MQARGTLTIPPALRRRYGLDRPGAQVEIIGAGDGLILRPRFAVGSPQEWFWDFDWQEGEREVERQRADGKGTVYESGEEFVQALETDG